MSATERAAPPPDTSESFTLPYAGLSLRIVAFILDCIVILSFLFVFYSIAGAQVLLRGGDDAPDSALYFLFLFPPAFTCAFSLMLFVFLWHWRGQSIGMMAVRIAVTDLGGGHLSYNQAVLRAILWPLSVLPLGIGLLPLFFGRERRALHDRLSGTVVLELP